MNRRIFIERRPGYRIEADELRSDFYHQLGIDTAELRWFISYDLFDINTSLFEQSIPNVFAEINRDIVHFEQPDLSDFIAYEFLPGQFDQRANSAEQCLRLLDPSTTVTVRSGILIGFGRPLSKKERSTLKHHLINTVEAREKDLSVLALPQAADPKPIPILDGFIQYDEQTLLNLHRNFGLAMSIDDLMFVQDYFQMERRDPTETELRVLDTYWSDHCRHTTFETELNEITFEDSMLGNEIRTTYQDYLQTKAELGRDQRPVTLMDLATINSRYERSQGNLENLEISEEINAASIHIDVDVDGKSEPWLLMFKNETHNHPTEIEPFGGASTCIGGAIRDPLSGRSYVYGAMRITGAADITEAESSTMEGKLPQRVISKEAARGYSSYGNQIGLATTFVEEVHHAGFRAKRMEVGAVIGAAPRSHVRRESPTPGDVVLLIGGRTGRDGIGGATGSSKAHTSSSIDEAATEVQKGNAPEERKIQRLFRNPDVSRRIKKSNDFGAGGVSVAIGELADGLYIDLNKVPTKYDGIDGTELAISESQERMAVVVDATDVTAMIRLCDEENLEATPVATVTANRRLVMIWNNQIICDVCRDFIDTAGVRQKASVHVVGGDVKSVASPSFEGTLADTIESVLSDHNVASKQGLEEMFDASIGRTTVLSPYGGRHLATKAQASVHRIPTRSNHTNTVSLMAYGYHPDLALASPYHGAIHAVVESMARIVATGGDHQMIRFTFQEYFERLGNDPTRWGKPFSALLGAYQTLKAFGLAAIGGKDSMSGSYHDLDVPPTLISFAVTTADILHIVSPEWKQSGSHLYLYDVPRDAVDRPDFNALANNFTRIHEHIIQDRIKSAVAITHGGLAAALIKSTFGNRIGIDIVTDLALFDLRGGAIVVETTTTIDDDFAMFLGHTTDQPYIRINDTTISIADALTWNRRTFEDVYPITHPEHRVLDDIIVPVLDNPHPTYPDPVDEVRVLIPVFPGTNCEYDSEDAFRQAGATTEIIVFNNQNEQSIANSIRTLADAIERSHILFLSGGFSSGDEPDGSGKFIANVLRQDEISQAIRRFLAKRHLILGICNGFQALVKSGLLPHGDVRSIAEEDPTLFKNAINRHVAKFVRTRVSSVASPWLSGFAFGDVHTVPVSHGEGRFILDDESYRDMAKNGQIAFQYVDDAGNPTYDPTHNPNGSSHAIEGILSKDGLILGKMAHSERHDDGLFQNIHGNKQQDLFQSAVRYFKGGDKQ